MKVQALPEKIQVLIHRDEDGLFWAESPDVPSCYTQGRTVDETLAKMTDAVLTHYEIDPTNLEGSEIKSQAKLKVELRFS